MAYIYSLNNAGGVAEDRLQLGNEEWLRPLSLSSGWYGLRIGIRWAIHGVGTLIGANMTIGMLTGINRPLRHPSGPVEAIVLYACNTSNPAYVASVSIPYYQTLGQAKVYSIVGSTNPAQMAVGTANNFTGAIYPVSTPIFTGIDMIRTATNYFVTPNTSAWTINVINLGAAPTTWCNHAQFWQNMETTATVVPAGTLTATAAAAHASPGLFDTLSISWNKSCPVIEIFDVAVTRIS